jgi:hypothetical protein
MMRGHPLIEGIMQEQVTQERRDDAALWSSLGPRSQVALLLLRRGLQPPLDIEEHPWVLGVLTHSLHQQVPREVVEEAFDIQIERPVILPAPLPALPNRVVRGFQRPVAVTVGMKERLQRRLQLHLDHHLRHPIRHGRYP